MTSCLGRIILFIVKGGTLTMKKIGTGYMGFAIGVIFGAVIATITSYSIFAIAGGNMSQAEYLQIRDCLIERLHE